MHLNAEEAKQLADDLMKAEFSLSEEAEVILAPPAVHIQSVRGATAGHGNISISGQTVHHAAKGAFTGELSAGMLRSVGADYVIIGHSERRQYFDETNAILYEKVKAALAEGLRPIYCLGESLEQREAGETFSHLRNQLTEGTFGLSPEDFSKLIIAYEPIWAIGTGVTASPAQAQEVHAHLRSLIREQYGDAIADSTSILYGGSVKPANAAELFACPDIDGGLVGGASLKADDFLQIISAIL